MHFINVKFPKFSYYSVSLLLNTYHVLQHGEMEGRNEDEHSTEVLMSELVSLVEDYMKMLIFLDLKFLLIYGIYLKVIKCEIGT